MKKLNKLVTRKNILISIIIATIILLVPIFWVSFYTVPSADDFNYGRNTINVLHSGGIFKVLQGSAKTVAKFYKTWQGTYSAATLFSLNPAVLSENFYFITTFFITGFYFFSLAYLFKQLLKKVLKVDKYIYWIVLLLFFMLCIETMIDKTQGLYWWNGATYYIIFFALEILEISLLIKKYFAKEESKKDTIWLYILIFIIGGGNFIVALQQIIILALLNIYLIIKKKDKSALPYLAFSIISFGISALAPGNKVRQNNLPKMNPFKAILLSFPASIDFMKVCISPLNTLILILIVIALYPTYQKINKKFSHPLIIIILMYCILSAEFTPVLYTMSASVGPGRLLNIIYFSCLFFVGISIYYLTGYIRSLLKERKILSKNSYSELIKYINEKSFLLLGSILIIFIVLVYPQRQYLTSYETTKLIMRNEIKTYKKEWKERYKILRDESVKEIKFKKLTYHPYPIFYTDLTNDKKHWLNRPIAEIYHKKSVIVVEPEEKE